MTIKPSAIEIDAVSQRFSVANGFVHALDGIQLAIGDGEFVSIVGPSGCGKSTIMRIVAGLIEPSAGSVRVFGETVNGPAANVGIVFQKATLLPWRSTIDNILLQIEMRDLPRAGYEARLRELVALTGLSGFEGALPHELSGGMQQRVALCRALIHDPAILLMDEPFGALDAMTRESMNLELQRVWMESRKSVLFITHSIAESVFLSDRVVVMTARPGRIADVIPIDLPRPRRFDMMGHPSFVAAAERVRQNLNSSAHID